MLILDISCQHLGDECKLEGFCVPFGHRVVECTFLKMYICIGYVMPTIWGVLLSSLHFVKLYFVNYAFCQLCFVNSYFVTSDFVKYVFVNYVLSTRILSNPEEPKRMALQVLQCLVFESNSFKPMRS